MLRVLRRCTLTLCLLSLCFTSADAQWTKVKSFPANVRCVYFLDQHSRPSIGFVGMYDGTIYRTADNGVNWSLVTTPPVGSFSSITSFDFRDSLMGWCSVNTSLFAANGIWVTKDGGLTWTEQQVLSQMVCVKYNPVSKMLFGINWAQQAMESTDLGLTWSNFEPSRQNGIAFNGSQGVISNLTAPGFLYTTDGGVSWKTPVPVLTTECWSPTAINSKDTFFAVGEKTGNLNRTTNGGASWNLIYTFSLPMNQPQGCITGTKNGLFVQTMSGFFTSTDLGATWFPICGPSHFNDTRFYSKQKEIWAADNQLNLWHNPDGTAGVSHPITFDQHSISMITSRCKSADSFYHFGYTGSCAAMLIGARLVSGTPFFVLGSITVPHVMGPLDSVDVLYTPSTALRDSGTLQLTFNVGGAVVDTLIPLIGVGLWNGYFRVPQLLAMVQQSACTPRDSLIAIRNLGCDTLTVTSAMLSDSSIFSLIPPLILPHKIVPGDSMFVRVHSGARSEGQFGARLQLHMRAATIQYDTSVTLALSVLPGGHPQFKPLALSLLNRCVSLDTVFTVVNPRCDSVILTATALSDTTYFKLLGLTLPQLLPPGSVLRIPVHVVAGKKGKYFASLLVSYLTASQQVDTAVDIAVQVRYDVPVQAMLSQARINFGTVTAPCDSARRTVHISNGLCLPLKIVAVRWASVDPQFTNAAAVYPILLQPGDEDSITIGFHPTAVQAQSVSLVVTLEVDGVQHDTTITVHGEGASIFSANLITPNVHFDSITPCNIDTRAAKIVNTMCHDVVVTSASLQLGSSYKILSPTLPLTLHAGDTITVVVRLNPGIGGAANDKLTVTFTDFGVDYPEEVALNGYVGPIKYGKAVTPAAMSFVNVAPCVALDTAITLTNRASCDDLIVDTAFLRGYNNVSFDAGLVFPIVLKPGESLRVGLHIHPSSDSATMAQYTFVGKGLDTTVSMVCQANAGGRQMTFSIADSAFHTRPCVPVTRTCQIVNNGCDSLTVDDLAVLGLSNQSQFAIVPTPVLPIRLGPGQIYPFATTYDPDGNGDNTAQLNIKSSIAKYSRLIALHGNYIGVVPVARVGLSASDGTQSLRSKAADTVVARVAFQDDIGDSVALKTATFEFKYDQQLLTLRTAIAGDGWTILDTSVTTSGSLHVKLKRLIKDQILKSAPLFDVSLVARVAASTSTPIELKNFRFNEDDANYERCTLSSLSMGQPVAYTMTDECGYDLLRSNMNGTLKTRIYSVQPNPAVAKNGVTSFEVNTISASSGRVSIVLRDVLGKVIVSSSATVHAGTDHLPIQAGHVTKGSYFLSIERDGRVESRKISIEDN